MGNVSTGGTWLPDEKLMHINVLELKPILLALDSFAKTSHKRINVMSENTTPILCIHKMVIPHSMECHQQVLKIWKWAIIHENDLSTDRISGTLNTFTDRESRSSHVDTKLMLQSKFSIWHKYSFFQPEIDIFSTNINAQFGKYASFRSDPGETYIGGFNFDWSGSRFYAFLLISVIPRAEWMLLLVTYAF